MHIHRIFNLLPARVSRALIFFSTLLACGALFVPTAHGQPEASPIYRSIIMAAGVLQQFNLVITVAKTFYI